MYNQNEDTIKSLIAQYQQRIYALVLYLAGQDQDRAYDICATSFTEAIRESPHVEQEEVLMVRLIGIAVEKCRNIKTIPTFDVIKFLEISEAEKGQLLIVLKALQTLGFEQKVPLLLRYQFNLSYGDIATVMLASESDARIKTAQARAQLDKEIERILSNT
jgi:DNA-directed RNA polymerase specialized sigma24 family protein